MWLSPSKTAPSQPPMELFPARVPSLHPPAPTPIVSRPHGTPRRPTAGAFELLGSGRHPLASNALVHHYRRRHQVGNNNTRMFGQASFFKGAPSGVDPAGARILPVRADLRGASPEYETASRCGCSSWISAMGCRRRTPTSLSFPAYIHIGCISFPGTPMRHGSS